MSEDKLAFGHVFNDEVTANQKTEAGKIVIFKKFDEGRNDYDGAYNFADLKKWLEDKSFATVIAFDDRAIEKIFQQGNPTIFLFHTNSDESKSSFDEFQAAAKELKGGKVLFSHSHPDDGHGHFQRLAEYVGVNTAKVPAIMLVHAGGEVNKYKFSDAITKDNVVSFVNKFNKGSLEKYYKTEEIPEKNDGPVKVLVGKNWQDEVINNNKDVLVKFYAPWCGHCKTLAPKWEEAAKQLSNNPNIVIAKIDSTLNEVPGVSIKGFPTLKFFPAGKKSSPIDFDGDRTEEGIIKFLKEKSSHPWVDSEAAKGDL
jgi:protein disulfide-isomerase A1